MGGEPTFVAVDDMDGVEWNFTALGDRKRELAGELLLRLKDRFAPGAMLYHGQGKWYPGEPLPRWALGCLWRADGCRSGRTRACSPPTPREGDGVDDVERFARTLAGLLGLDAGRLIPAYEDIWIAITDEARLPVNVDPLSRDLGQPAERAKLARMLEEKLGEVAGYVLPLEAAADTAPGRAGCRPHGRCVANICT
jgi:uncharacterized protein (DUF2126 family)